MSRFLLIAALVSAIPAFAEDPFSFEKTPGRLPKEVVPLHYAIRLEPNAEQATFAGEVQIDIEARKPAKELVLNSLGLQISEATLDGKPIKAAADNATQLLKLSGTEVTPGKHRISLRFTGKLTEQPQGLYLARYQLPNGDQRKALVTQMEPSDARRMFPCWDEPAFRSTFQLTAVVPAGHTALYNMAAEKETTLPGGKREVVFGTSPAMSSYLVAFVSAELEAIEDEVDGVKLRILATPGKREQMRYAMEATKKVLPYFNEYFGVKYPLPKLDQVSFPSVAVGGMENWGCIIYSDTALLFDPVSSSQYTRERVFNIVAHEIAHQWFGDLVTMAWWDNLWLNEGFASWMATKASDHFNPSWKKWLRAAGSKELAMRLDARSTTHPIQQPVVSEAQAMQAFDEITYQKGQAFLRMLETWLGDTKFRDGLRAYFKKHAYSNTTTADLWSALQDSSGLEVRKMAAGWTEQPGFPIVRVSEAGLAQNRFTIHQTNPPPLSWEVPISWRRSAQGEDDTLLLSKSPAPLPKGEGAFVINPVGYFRVSYEGPVWEKLKPQIPNLDEAGRLAIAQDTWALVQSGQLPLARWLEVAAQLRHDPSPTIGDHLVEVLSYLDHLARGNDERPVFRAWGRDFLAPRFKRLGWTGRAGEEPATAGHRAGLISLLGRFGDPAIVTEAQERAAKFLEKADTLPGDLREPVLYLAGRMAEPALWERFHAKAKATPDAEQKNLLYGALVATRDVKLAQRALALSLTGELPSKLATRLVGRVASEGEKPELAWEFAKSKLPELLALLSAMDADEFLPRFFRQFTEAERADELEAFTKANFPPDAAKPAAISADDIRFKAKFKARILPEFSAWLKTQVKP
jgi:aminopeptidase N